MFHYPWLYHTNVSPQRLFCSYLTTAEARSVSNPQYQREYDARLERNLHFLVCYPTGASVKSDRLVKSKILFDP